MRIWIMVTILIALAVGSGLMAWFILGLKAAAGS